MTGSNNTADMKILDEMEKTIQVVKSKIDYLKGGEEGGATPGIPEPIHTPLPPEPIRATQEHICGWRGEMAIRRQKNTRAKNYCNTK